MVWGVHLEAMLGDVGASWRYVGSSWLLLGHLGDKMANKRRKMATKMPKMSQDSQLNAKKSLRYAAAAGTFARVGDPVGTFK